jgi:hypothetical protein
MKNHIQLGLAALGTLAYSSLFLLLPETALNLSNGSWALFLNVFGFFCFLGGWSIFLRLFSSNQKRFFSSAQSALLFEVLVLAGSPAAYEFVQINLNQYLMFCAGFFGPIASSIYILWMAVKVQQGTAPA